MAVQERLQNFTREAKRVIRVSKKTREGRIFKFRESYRNWYFINWFYWFYYCYNWNAYWFIIN